MREGLNKVIAFFAEYARKENDEKQFDLLDELEELPVSELIRLAQLNNKTEEPHVQ